MYCAHSSRHCRSSITGRRWMTTLRKLPTTRPSTREVPMNMGGDAASSSITDMRDSRKRRARRGVSCEAERRTRSSDHRTELEDRQVHRDHEAADQDAEHYH